MSEPIWIKDPLAILAEGAGRGVVVQDGAIVELVGAGSTPQTAAPKPSTPASTSCCPA